jgi:hypothetical protein
LPNDGREEDQPGYENKKDQLIKQVKDEIVKSKLEVAKAESNVNTETLGRRWTEMEDILKKLVEVQ